MIVSNAIAVPQETHHSTKQNVGPIVGGTVGGLLGACLIVVGFVVVYRKSRARREAQLEAEEKYLEAQIARLPPPEPYNVWQPPSRSSAIRNSSTENLVEATQMSKEQEHQYGQLVGASSSSMSRSLSTGTLSSAGSSSGLLRQSNPFMIGEVVELRTQVEQLREVMQAIQTERTEPPPLYTDTSR